MKKDMVDFDVPQYITEEINEYITDKKNGKCRFMKLDNIKALIGLAILNGRITKEQGEDIINRVLVENY